MGSLLLLVIGLGCGNAADLDAENCCKQNASCHRGSNDSVDPNQCCQQNQQAKPKMSAHSDADLTKRALELDSLQVVSFQNWTDDINLTFWNTSSIPVFKLPQQEIYQLTSALLI